MTTPAEEIANFMPDTPHERALLAVLLFHDSSIWDGKKCARWYQLTGVFEATTKVLCDTVRKALLT